MKTPIIKPENTEQESFFMNQTTYNSLKAFIWGIANDCLVDVYDVGDYRKVTEKLLTRTSTQPRGFSRRLLILIRLSTTVMLFCASRICRTTTRAYE